MRGYDTVNRNIWSNTLSLGVRCNFSCISSFLSNDRALLCLHQITEWKRLDGGELGVAG